MKIGYGGIPLCPCSLGTRNENIYLILIDKRVENERRQA